MSDETGQPEQEQPEAEADQQPEPEGRDQRRDAHTREQLRATETERDALRERVEQFQRREVEAAARAALGEHGAAMWTYDLPALLSESGDVDPERVRESLEPLRLALEEGRSIHHGDLGPRKTQEPSGATWGQVIGGR